MNTKGYLISAVLAGFLVGCGGGSSSTATNSNTESKTDKKDTEVSKGELKKINTSKNFSANIKDEVGDALQGYAEAGDNSVVTLDAVADIARASSDGFIIVGNKWHNALTVVNATTKKTKVTAIGALKNAGHGTVDATTGASEPTLNQVTYANGHVYTNIYSKKDTFHKESVGIHKGKISDDGTVDEVTKSANGDNFKSFIVSNDGKTIVASDGANVIVLDENLKEKSSNEATMLASTFTEKNIPIIAFKKGLKVFISKSTQMNEDIELAFEPSVIKCMGENKALLVEKSDRKPIKLHVLDMQTGKELSNTAIGEINSSSQMDFDVSPNKKYLLVGHEKGVSIIELYTGKMNVVKIIDSEEVSGAKFISDTAFAYGDSENAIVIKFAEAKENMTNSDLLEQKLTKKMTKDVINENRNFNEVRNKMDFSNKKLYGVIDVTYTLSSELTNVIKADGTVTMPDTSVSGTLTITGKQGNDTGSIKIPLRIIGKDMLKSNIIFDDKQPINTVVLGDDRVVVAFEDGLRVYKIENDTLTLVGDTVSIEGIDSLMPQDIFAKFGIFALDKNTVIGLGRVDSSKKALMKGWEDEPDEKETIYNHKIFKVTIDDKGVVNPKASFIDIGADEIVNIDLSDDKSTLAVLLHPKDGQYKDDPENRGYKIGNDAPKTFKLYSFESKSAKGPFDIKREGEDKTSVGAISINQDGSLVMVNETHEPGAILKIYDKDGKKVFTGSKKISDKNNHMSANFLVGNSIVFAPFKGSGFTIIDKNSPSNPITIPYIDGGGWYNKGVVDGDTIYMTNAAEFKSKKTGVVKYKIGDEKATETYYKMFKDSVPISLFDVDFAGSKVILTGIQNRKDGYLNIQDKK